MVRSLGLVHSNPNPGRRQEFCPQCQLHLLSVAGQGRQDCSKARASYLQLAGAEGLPRQDESRKVEALLARRGALAAKKADLERRVRELGSLPADAFERYRGQALPALHGLLAKAQAQLKKFQCAPWPGPS